MYKRDDRLRKNFIDLLGRCQAAGRGLYPRPFPILPLASVNTFTMQSPLFFFYFKFISLLLFLLILILVFFSSPLLLFSFYIPLSLRPLYILLSIQKHSRGENAHTRFLMQNSIHPLLFFFFPLFLCASTTSCRHIYVPLDYCPRPRPPQ